VRRCHDESPYIKNITEQLNLEVRVFHRDDDTNLIDQYLTNGTARSIPIFVFLNDDDQQETVWGPRARQAQNLLMKVERIYLQRMILLLRKNQMKFMLLSLIVIKLTLNYGKQFTNQ
jgi:hypothetical protein